MYETMAVITPTTMKMWKKISVSMKIVDLNSCKYSMITVRQFF